MFGQGIAQSFEIPMQQPEPVVRDPRTSVGRGSTKQDEFDLTSLGLEKPPTDLQVTSNVDDLVSGIYNDWSELTSYAKTMHKKYGIDVMAPDPGNEFAYRSSNAFKKMVANLAHRIEKAKRGAESIKNLQTSAFAGNIDVAPGVFAQGQFASEVPVPQQFASNKLPEEFNLIKDSVNRAVETGQDMTNLKGKVAEFIERQKRAYDANPTEDNKRRLDAAYSIGGPIWKIDNTGKAGGGTGGFVENELKKVALISKGSSMYFKPTAKRDSAGNIVSVSDQFAGRQFGTTTITRDNGAVAQIPFEIDHLEYRPGEGGTFAVAKITGERRPFSDKGPVEIMRTLNYIPAQQIYKYLSDSPYGDVITAENMLGPQDVSTLPTPESYTQGSGAVLEQRGELAKTMETGKPAFMPTLPGLGFINKIASTFGVSKPVELTNPQSGVKVSVEKGNNTGTVKLSSEAWKNIFGTATQVVVDGEPITKSNAVKGIPSQQMVKLLEEQGFISYENVEENPVRSEAAERLRRLRGQK